MGGKFVGKVIGFSCIFSIAFCWAMTGELTQNLQTPGSEDYYPKAFFITYLTTSSGIVWLIPWLIWKFCGLYISKWTPTERKINAKREFFYAKWAPAMMCAITGLNYTWYLSLKHTPVSVNSVIYNCAAIEVFIISVPLLNEGVSILKIAAVVVSLTGVALIVFLEPSDPDTDEIESTWYGYLLLLLSLSIYAWQEVSIKILSLKAAKIGSKMEDDDTNVDDEEPIPREKIQFFESELQNPTSKKGTIQDLDDNREETLPLVPNQNQDNDDTVTKLANTAFYIGASGFCNMTMMVWMVVVWNYAGWEKFEWPSQSQTNLLLITCGLNVIMMFSIFTGTAFLSPLMVSLGSLLVIPMTFLLDFLFHSYYPAPIVCVGMVLILLGFCFIVTANEKASSYSEPPTSKRPLDTVLYNVFHEYHFSKNEEEGEKEVAA